MPGTLLKVLAKKGDKVKKGAPLFILEAMKMEHTVRATVDAVVKEVRGKESTLVEGHVLIMELE
jgi:biotin carboxyl carrier protein